jgi:hypothetical protein
LQDFFQRTYDQKTFKGKHTFRRVASADNQGGQISLSKNRLKRSLTRCYQNNALLLPSKKLLPKSVQSPKERTFDQSGHPAVNLPTYKGDNPSQKYVGWSVSRKKRKKKI